MKLNVKKMPIGIASKISILLTVLIAAKSLSAVDWPTYMHDNARSGVTAESLILAELNPGWIITSPARPQVAWDGGQPWDAFAQLQNVPMRNFDFAFYVTVVGDLLYYGSSVTDSVHCINVNTGKQNWFFHTEGPVRYPPAYYDGKLYFGSDDGYAYCIDAKNGSFNWKYSPSGGEARQIGNNGSIIPMWPVRTGTAIRDGKVYFAASLVSWKGSYLCAIDAQSGSDVGSGLYKVSGGPAPMGAILASPDRIYLMQGRQWPRSFNRATGGGGANIGTANRNGGCYSLLTSDTNFAYGHGGATGYKITESGDKVATYPDGRCMIVSGEVAYIINGNTLKAINRNSGITIWSVPCDCQYSLILTDNVLFAGGTNNVVAYSITNGSELWTGTVNGHVYGLAAAGGRLFASTDTGNIHMFGKHYFPADFDEDSFVNIVDFLFFCNEFLRSTNPTNPVGEDLRD